MNDIESVLLGRIVKRSLSIDVLIINSNPFLDQQIQTFLLTLPANIKHDSLLVVVFEMRISAGVDQKFHDAVGCFVVDHDRGEIKRRLSGLRFQTIHDFLVVLLQEFLNLIYRADLSNSLPTFYGYHKVVDCFVCDLLSVVHV